MRASRPCARMGAPRLGSRTEKPRDLPVDRRQCGPETAGRRKCWMMPLSEDEQRILREIEENLSATDPKLVEQLQTLGLEVVRAAQQLSL